MWLRLASNGLEILAFGGIEIAVGVLTILISLPLLWERIPDNFIYGFRIPEAFKSDEAWYDINRYGARQLIIWSLPLIASGILKLILPFHEWHVSTNAMSTLTICMILLCLRAPIRITEIYATRWYKQQ